jgi:hypothetical protein
MNGSKIEIIRPFNQALELTKQILFRPFNLEKWLVIGFAAFLAHFGGGGYRFNFPFSWKRDFWRSHAWGTGGYTELHHLAPWVWILLIIGVPTVMAIGLLLAWIGSRGRFIFVDCVVHDRGAIAAAWHEYRREGNSLFLFSLAVVLALIAIALIGIVPIILPAVLHHSLAGVTMTLSMVFWIALIVVIALAWSVISQLMMPLMYRQRCRAWDAFQKVLTLVSEHAVSFILYVLFIIAVSILVTMVIVALTCLTCCLAGCLFGLPYIGTVILLPLEVLMLGYTLFFLRQFGSDFDVWFNVHTAPAATPPQTSLQPPPTPPVPPIQT